MTTCKEESLRWVHRYAAGGAVFAAIPLPVSTSAGLVALETYMVHFIGTIYGDSATGMLAAASGGSFTVMGQGLKWAAMQATCFVPVLGSVIRVAIAAATIESLGRAVIAHFERKYPAKELVPPVPAS